MIKKRIVTLLNCFIVNSSFSKRGRRKGSSNLAIQQYNNRKPSEAGFTLVEIIVVIAIIGILTSFLVANFTNIKRNSRDAQRKADLRGIQASLEIYRSDKGSYPTSSPISTCPGSWTESGNVYIQTIPCDPLGEAYTYNYLLSSGGYSLIACLENIDDQQKDDTKDLTYCTGIGEWSFTLKNP